MADGLDKTRKRCLLSSFGEKEKKEYTVYIEKLNGYCVQSPFYKQDCDIIICKQPSRGEKYLCGCASGKFVLTPGYLKDSVKVNRWLVEDTYEWCNQASLNGVENELLNLSKKCKEYQKKNGGKLIFGDWKVLLHIEEKTKREAYKRLLEAGGAKIINISPPFRNDLRYKITHAFVTKVTSKDLKILQRNGFAHVFYPEYIAEYLIQPKPPTLYKYQVFRKAEKSSSSSSIQQSFAKSKTAKVQSPSRKSSGKNRSPFKLPAGQRTIFDMFAKKRKAEDSPMPSKRACTSTPLIAQTPLITDIKTEIPVFSPSGVRTGAPSTSPSINSSLSFETVTSPVDKIKTNLFPASENKQIKEKPKDSDKTKHKTNLASTSDKQEKARNPKSLHKTAMLKNAKKQSEVLILSDDEEQLPLFVMVNKKMAGTVVSLLSDDEDQTPTKGNTSVISVNSSYGSPLGDNSSTNADRDVSVQMISVNDSNSGFLLEKATGSPSNDSQQNSVVVISSPTAGKTTNKAKQDKNNSIVSTTVSQQKDNRADNLANTIRRSSRAIKTKQYPDFVLPTQNQLKQKASNTTSSELELMVTPDIENANLKKKPGYSVEECLECLEGNGDIVISEIDDIEIDENNKKNSLVLESSLQCSTPQLDLVANTKSKNKTVSKKSECLEKSNSPRRSLRNSSDVQKPASPKLQKSIVMNERNVMIDTQSLSPKDERLAVVKDGIKGCICSNQRNSLLKFPIQQLKCREKHENQGSKFLKRASFTIRVENMIESCTETRYFKPAFTVIKDNLTSFHYPTAKIMFLLFDKIQVEETILFASEYLNLLQNITFYHPTNEIAHVYDQAFQQPFEERDGNIAMKSTGWEYVSCLISTILTSLELPMDERSKCTKFQIELFQFLITLMDGELTTLKTKCEKHEQTEKGAFEKLRKTVLWKLLWLNSYDCSMNSSVKELLHFMFEAHKYCSISSTVELSRMFQLLSHFVNLMSVCCTLKDKFSSNLSYSTSCSSFINCFEIIFTTAFTNQPAELRQRFLTGLRPNWLAYRILNNIISTWDTSLVTRDQKRFLNEPMSIKKIIYCYFFMLPLSNTKNTSRSSNKKKTRNSIESPLKDIQNKKNVGKSTPKSINRRNAKGETPLQVACIKNDPSRVKELLLMGASVNMADHAGWTPLHEACNYGFIQCVEELLKSPDLNVYVKSGNEISVLHDAVENNHVTIAEKLLVRGGRKLLDLKTSDEKTAFDFAKTDQMKSVLLKYQVDGPAQQLAGNTVKPTPPRVELDDSLYKNVAVFASSEIESLLLHLLLLLRSYTAVESPDVDLDECQGQVKLLQAHVEKLSTKVSLRTRLHLNSIKRIFVPME